MKTHKETQRATFLGFITTDGGVQCEVFCESNRSKIAYVLSDSCAVKLKCYNSYDGKSKGFVYGAFVDEVSCYNDDIIKSVRQRCPNISLLTHIAQGFVESTYIGKIEKQNYNL